MADLTVSSAVDTLMQATNQAGIRTAAGLGNVDNTSDANKPISSATQAALDAKIGRFATITESTTARTLGLTDAQKYIRTTSSSATTITVPPQASVAWLADTEIVITQTGTGQVTIAAGAGVTINTAETLKSAKRYAAMTLKRVAENAWDLFGNLEAA